MGECDVIGCEGDSGLPYTCNECDGQFCSKHRLPENHNCRVLQSKTGDGTPLSTGLQDKDEKKRGITDRLRKKAKGESPSPMDLSDHTIGISDSKKTTTADTNRSKSSSPEPESLAERSRTSNSTDYASNRLILTTVSSILRKLAVIAVIFGVVLGLGVLGGGSVPSPDEASGAIMAALNETDEFVSSFGTQSNQTTKNPPASTEFNRENVEQRIHEEINDERTQRNLAPLSFDNDLREIARYHSEDMVSSGYFAHTSPDGESMEDRYQKFGYQCQVSMGDTQYTTGGENIAKTYYETTIALENGSTVHHDTPEELAEGVVQQWMNSEGHRENILKPYWNNEGIGVETTEEDGATAVYVTQNFC